MSETVIGNGEYFPDNWGKRVKWVCDWCSWFSGRGTNLQHCTFFQNCYLCFEINCSFAQATLMESTYTCCLVPLGPRRSPQTGRKRLTTKLRLMLQKRFVLSWALREDKDLDGQGEQYYPDKCRPLPTKLMKSEHMLQEVKSNYLIHQESRIMS